jgi:hypothetical protein
MGGSVGEVFYNITATDVESFYRPCGTGFNTTGWTCTNKTTSADFCVQ